MFNNNPKPTQENKCPHGYVAEVLDNPDNVASATGATGLVPTPPQDEAQAAAYSDIYAIPQQPQQIEPGLSDQEKKKR